MHQARDESFHHHRREHRRRRLKRHGRRAYIRSVYSLPSLATLGNAICGFGTMYVATLDPNSNLNSPDHLTRFFSQNNFVVGAYLIFLAMLFDAIDGRLARFTRHTTDFGGQLDSLADVLSFGAAPAFLMLEVFKHDHPLVLTAISRLIWSIGALYMSCAAMRLARFNVSNEHGEQHHFSFLGLPSPGAGGAVAAFVLMHEELKHTGVDWLSIITGWLLPLIVLATGLLMVSAVRYPHIVNRYLRGKRSVDRVLVVLILLLLLVVWHQYTLAMGTLAYAMYGPAHWLLAKMRPKRPPPPPPPTAPLATTAAPHA